MNMTPIIEGNKLIAEYMGFTERFDLRTDGKPMYQAPIEGDATHSPCYSSDEHEEFMQLEYHSSWDWLMPVIKKISDCRIMVNDSATPVIMKSGLVKRELIRLDIFKTWLAVIEFIKWYNSQNPKQ